MALAHGEVIGVMRRSDFHRPRAEFGIDKFVADHFDLTVNERQYQRLADIFFIPFVLGVHRDSRVAQHGFGTCGGHDNKLTGIVFKRITQMIQISLQFAVFRLFIGKGCLATRAPIDGTVPLIN